MSETLYRKYRPKDFAEVIGQESIVSVLQKALKSGTTSHAYIFAGSRGTGKTTIARIFATALGSSGNDIYEIDAASNNGVDEIRMLNEAVNTLPFDSKYKVYILDEAHMLSKSAWNALLKTLEEPPSHVLFILATTEIEKIPDTIISRCEVHTFKKPDHQTLVETIKRTGKAEGYSVESGAAEVLALLADGSFRDAHGALQKIISSVEGKKVTLADVETISGAPRSAQVEALVDAIAGKDITKAIGVIAELRSENRDVKAFMKLVLEKTRLILLTRISGVQTSVSDMTKEHQEFIKAHADKKDGINSGTLLALLEAYERVARSSFPDIALEATLLALI